jgi:hypothetical protein
MTCHLVRYLYFLVLAAGNPRTDGCLDPIEDDVLLNGAGLSDPVTGQVPGGLCVGRDLADVRTYYLFRTPSDRSRAGSQQVVGTPIVVPTWDAFLRVAADRGEPVG